MTIHIGKWYVPRQLLQSCQGCVPSTTNSISMLSPSRNVLMQNRLSHSMIELPPLGRALKKSPFFMTKTENAYDL